MKSLIQIWKSFCSSQCKHLEYASEEPTYRAIQLLMYDVVIKKADMIVFGEPPQPYEIEELPPPPTIAQQLASGDITKEQADEENKRIQEFESFDEKNKPFFDKSFQEGPFASSPVRQVPVLCRRNGKWYHAVPISIDILHVFVDHLAFHSKSLFHVNHLGQDYDVRYTMRMENNYCYSIKIMEVKEIPN
jgi:hypothetical protein